MTIERVGTQSPTDERRALIMGSETMPTPEVSIPQTTPNVNAGALKLVSAYGKENAQGLLNSSEILYFNPDKERTETWMQRVGLQLPSDTTTLGSIGRITYQDGEVKSKAGKAMATPASQSADPLILEL